MSSTFLTLANILYVLVSVAMIVMILLQRGAGAGAGAGFGGGASATVFGARGAANFLSRSTAVLAVLFFVISLSMAMYVARGGRPAPVQDLGVMGSIPAAEAQIPPVSAPVQTEIPAAAPAVEVPVESPAEDEVQPPSEGDSGS